jgi:PD-(D/E)XK endonuclease
MRHKTKDKGDLGVAKTIPHLLSYGIRSCLPISEHLPFDLIAVMPDFTTLRRVQVKYRKISRNGVIELSFRSNYYDSKHIYSKAVDLGEIDCYAIFNPDEQDIFYLRVDEIPEDSIAITLRIDAPKNGQKKGVWIAKDYNDPRRIALTYEPLPAARRELGEKDEFAVAQVIADLIELGIQPCKPISSFIPFDLIAVHEDMKTLKRLRVGCETVETNPYVDQYALYVPDMNTCLYVDADQIPADCPHITVGMLARMAQPQAEIVG